MRELKSLTRNKEVGSFSTLCPKGSRSKDLYSNFPPNGLANKRTQTQTQNSDDSINFESRLENRNGNKQNYSYFNITNIYLLPKGGRGFLHGSVVKNPLTNVGDAGSIPESRRFPWGRKWQFTSVFLTRESHGQRSLVDLVGCIVHRVINRWT